MTMAKPLKWLTGLLTRIGRTAGSARTGAPCGSRMKIPEGFRVVSARDVLPPLLPEPFAALLDIDALEREAEEIRQAKIRQPQGSRETKGLRAFLLPDVTRTEELILTAELWRIGACVVDCQARPRASGQRTASPLLLLFLTERGLRVDLFSCANYNTKGE